MWAWLAVEFSPGVGDDRQRLQVLGHVTVAGDQLVDRGAELGDVGPVAGVGVADQGDPAVAGDDQSRRSAAGRCVSVWPCRAERSALWGSRESMNVAKLVASTPARTGPARTR
jgi:hypothetical protein